MENRELFDIDENGLLIINKVEARQIQEFKLILQRDKGSEGDFNGKKKYQAFKEFMYIYLVSSPKSIYRDLPIKERKAKAKKKAELNGDWKEGVLIKEAIDKYERILKLSSAEYSYYNASRGIYSIGKDLDLFNQANDRLRIKINKLQLSIEDDVNLTTDEIESMEHQLDVLTENLSKNTQEIIKLNKVLPDAFDSLEKLYKKMMEEQRGDNKLYGGGKLGNREE